MAASHQIFESKDDTDIIGYAFAVAGSSGTKAVVASLLTRGVRVVYLGRWHSLCEAPFCFNAVIYAAAALCMTPSRVQSLVVGMMLGRIILIAALAGAGVVCAPLATCFQPFQPACNFATMYCLGKEAELVHLPCIVQPNALTLP
eukprot:716952-Pelagomonas_calceolata.AAC.3